MLGIKNDKAEETIEFSEDDSEEENKNIQKKDLAKKNIDNDDNIIKPNENEDSKANKKENEKKVEFKANKSNFFFNILSYSIKWRAKSKEIKNRSK